MRAFEYDSFQAIADTNRREILNLLAKEKLSINMIAENFDISRPAISKHIKILQATGFVTIEQSGRERICTLNQKGFENIQDWIDHFEQYWTSQLLNLDNYLKKSQPKN